MKLGSLFDGSGTCPLAAAMCGIEPVWASEIEPYPIRVTKKNFPGMKHLGDIAKIKGNEIEPVDVITFGSPCQDLSIAGNRAGIKDGKRSSLFFEAIRIIKEMRAETNGRYPTFAVWENVPGAFSSNKGRDFLAVLRAFAKAAQGAGADVPEPNEKQGKLQWSKDGCIMGDGWSVAWRMLDANIGECPKDASESTLWQILQADAPEKYYLSARACKGILRRAERRGKELPQILREALEEAIALGV